MSAEDTEHYGFVLVDKEPGWTSHDVVARCRRLFGQRRIGHGGTLDPDATGLLVVILGRATRLQRFATLLGKTYVGEIVLGTSTSTLDASGTVTGEFDMSGVTLEQVQVAAAGLTGRIQQRAPMVSAVKVGGRRLHELEREGIEVERPLRTVNVTRFDVEAVDDEPLVYRAHVDCSSGTYVRVLAADLGETLGGGAHLRALRRMSIGSFRVEDAVQLSGLGPESVLPVEELVRDLPAAHVEDSLELDVRHGKVLERAELGMAGEGPWAVFGAAGLLAVYEAAPAERVKPAVVMLPVSGSPDTSPGTGDEAG